jgi:molybdate transport system permease protein
MRTWMLPGSLWQVAALPMLVFLALPILALLAAAQPMQLLQNLQNPLALMAMRTSLVTTTLSLAATLLFGTPVAYLLARRRFRLQRWIDALVDLPTVLPPSVAGVALLLALGRRGLLGEWLHLAGVQIAFSPAAVVLAQLFVSAPFYMRSAQLGFAAVEIELQQAAQLDGASRWQVFRHISLPLARPALVSGALLSWARALGEFGATILFAGNLPGRTQTMATAIYLGFESDLNLAITLSVLLLSLSLVVLLAVKALAGREER